VSGRINQPLTIGERLLTILPEGDASVCPDGLQKHRERLCNRPVVAPYVKPAQEI
jgi:hypothetical protein